MKLKQEFSKRYSKNISFEKKLSNLSWFNLGGNAEYFFKPENKDQLIEFLKENKKNKLNINILGAGSNTLIRDNGVKGVVIKLGSNFSKIKLENMTTIQVGAACPDRRISYFGLDNGLSNFEFLSCIPGSIGGSIIMNSGCYGYDISKILISVDVIDIKNCVEKQIQREDIKFFYRGTNLSSDLIVTSVKLKGEPKSKKLIEKKLNEMIERKKLSQPSQIKTCGSTFKNISNEKKAWEIIKETGCDKLVEGDAQLSNKHCNFFVNNGRASAQDIEKLINRVKKIVNEKTGINLELEIKIIGE